MSKISKVMYTRKNYLKQLEDSEGNGLVKVITGIRRAGKSVLLSELFHQHLIDKGVDESQIIDIALDDRDYAEFLNPDVFLSYVKSRIRKGKVAKHGFPATCLGIPWQYWWKGNVNCFPLHKCRSLACEAG